MGLKLVIGMVAGMLAACAPAQAPEPDAAAGGPLLVGNKGEDTLSFVAAGAQVTDRINMLAAIRCGEMQPIMLADAALFLISPLSRGITGEVIYVDGGYHILGV